jgi:hypothetical protein
MMDILYYKRNKITSFANNVYPMIDNRYYLYYDFDYCRNADFELDLKYTMYMSWHWRICDIILKYLIYADCIVKNSKYLIYSDNGIINAMYVIISNNEFSGEILKYKYDNKTYMITWRFSCCFKRFRVYLDIFGNIIRFDSCKNDECIKSLKKYLDSVKHIKNDYPPAIFTHFIF